MKFASVIIIAFVFLSACNSGHEDVYINLYLESDNFYSEIMIDDRVEEIEETPYAEKMENGVPLEVAMYGLCDCGELLRKNAVQVAEPLRMIPFGNFGYFQAEMVSSLENIHEYKWHCWDGGWNNPLVIWTETTLRDFSLVALRLNDLYEPTAFITSGVLFSLDTFTPEDVFVFNVLFCHYLIPRVGVVFTDENDVQRRMFINEDLWGILPPACVCMHRFALIPHGEETSDVTWANWGWYDSELQPWQIAYIELLSEYSTQRLGCEGMEHLGVIALLHDINLDGVPELIVADSFHFTSYLAVYTFKNNELIQLEVERFYDYSPLMIAPVDGSPGLVQLFGEAQYSGVVHLVMDGNRLVVKNIVERIAGWGRDDGETAWYVNEVEATQEEFQEAHLKFFGFEDTSLLEWEVFEPIWETRIQTGTIQDIREFYIWR